MPIGYGAAGNPTAKKRKLPKVSTFRDMQSGAAAGPSATKPSGVGGFQPGGFGPAGVGGAKVRKTAGAATRTATGQPHTTSGYVTSATPPVPERTYSEASRLPQAAGLGAPSPVFGAGAIPEFAKGPGVDPGISRLTEAGQQVPTGAEPGDAMGARGRGELGVEESMEALDWGYDIEVPGEGEPEGIRPPGEQPGLRGVAAEQAAGGFAEKEEVDTLDQEMQGLIDEHKAAWGDTEDKLNAQLATAMRRQAEVNAAMGSSVSGGYAGATAATILGSLQVMADAYAAHQKEGRNLQLSWLEKRMNMDFEREGWAVQDARMALSELLSDPEAEISEEAWEAAYPDAAERAAAKESVEGGGGLPGAEGAAPEGTTGEPGALKNEAGDLLVGAGGLGTSGTVRADPLSGEGEEHQWYARGTGGQYEYYRLDEDGNEVPFEAEPGGARFPGDRSLTARTTAATGAPGWGMGNHPTHGNDGVVKAAGSDFVAYRGAEVAPFLEYLDTRYAAGNSSDQGLTMEMGLFISHYKSQNDGDAPTWEEMEEHADRTGLLKKA